MIGLKSPLKQLAGILCLLVTTFVNGQNDKEAEQLLNAVNDKTASYENISITFKYVLSNISENIKEQVDGDVLIEGDKYKLNIYGVTRIFDGKTLYTISPDDEEVTISTENSEDENTITPSKILSFYKTGYAYQMDITQNVKGKKIQYVKLIPMDSETEIKSVLLGIDINTKNIYNLIEVGKNNSNTTLTVTKLVTNQTLATDTFKFNKTDYPDYFINNLD